MEGYVLRRNQRNNPNLSSRLPLRDKTNIIVAQNVHNVKKIMKKLKEVPKENVIVSNTKLNLRDEKKADDGIVRTDTVRKGIRSRRQSMVASKENTQTNGTNVNSNMAKVKVTTRSTSKSKDKVIEQDLLQKSNDLSLGKDAIVYVEKKIQDPQTKNVNGKKLRFVDGDKETTKTSTGKRILRKRDTPHNYAEESLNETKISDETDEVRKQKINVPIYKRVSLLKKPKPKKSDVYELDVSSDDGGKKCRRRRKKSGGSPNNSLPFERYMQVFVNKLDENYKKGIAKKSRGKPRNKNNNRKKPLKMTKKIQPIQDKNVQKLLKVTEVTDFPLKTPKIDVISNIPVEIELIKCINTVRGKSNHIILKRKQTDPHLSAIADIFDDDNGHESDVSHDESSDHNVNRNPNKSVPAEHIISIRKQTDPNLSSVPDIFDNDNGHKYNVSQNESSDDNINVKCLNRNNEFDINSPIGHSTMINNNFQGARSPWRLDIEFQRNPHFLQYKNSFLPNYNQEMVLDSSVIDKTLQQDRTANISKIVQPARKQASILKYVSGGKNMENLNNINLECSLFDEHEFSPPKRISPKKKNTQNKENVIQSNESVKQRKKVDLVKRNILSPKVNNIENIVGNERSNRKSSTNSSELDLFGFDNSEVVVQVEDPNCKPLRIDPVIPAIIKVQKEKPLMLAEYKTKKQKERVDEGANLQEIGLFEDYHPERNLDYSTVKQYKCKKPRRRRSPTPDGTETEDEDHHVTHKVKRKKDVRTREEQAKYEKWASEFNKMCKEVDNFALEIE